MSRWSHGLCSLLGKGSVSSGSSPARSATSFIQEIGRPAKIPRCATSRVTPTLTRMAGALGTRRPGCVKRVAGVRDGERFRLKESVLVCRALGGIWELFIGLAKAAFKIFKVISITLKTKLQEKTSNHPKSQGKKTHQKSCRVSTSGIKPGAA